MKNLIIIGTTSFARETFWHAQNSIGYNKDFRIKGFIEGTRPFDIERNKQMPLEVFGTVFDYQIEEEDVFVIAIADVAIKEEIYNIMKNRNACFYSLIHKTANVATDAAIGEGSIICPYAFLSCNISVGKSVIINAYSSMGHDAQIGDFSSVMGHVDITGFVTAGIKTYWGSGSRALPGSIIGDCATIGAGSVVLKKVKKDTTVFGIPAMPI